MQIGQLTFHLKIRTLQGFNIGISVLIWLTKSTPMASPLNHIDSFTLRYFIESFSSGFLLKKILWQYELVQHLLPVGLNFPDGAGSITVWEDDNGVGNDDVYDVDVNDDA